MPYRRINDSANKIFLSSLPGIWAGFSSSEIASSQTCSSSTRSDHRDTCRSLEASCGGWTSPPPPRHTARRPWRSRSRRTASTRRLRGSWRLADAAAHRSLQERSFSKLTNYYDERAETIQSPAPEHSVWGKNDRARKHVQEWRKQDKRYANNIIFARLKLQTELSILVYYILNSATFYNPWRLLLHPAAWNTVSELCIHFCNLQCIEINRILVCIYIYHIYNE